MPAWPCFCETNRRRFGGPSRSHSRSQEGRRFKYILLFKNHGEAAGASLEHSHSQLIALPIVPIYVAEELQGAKQYYIYKERCVFCDAIRQETENGSAWWRRTKIF